MGLASSLSKAVFQALRKEIWPVFRELARQKESKVGEGYIMPDHVHMMLSVPPKYSVSQVVGFIKDKKRNFVGQKFWARGFFVSTVGRDEEVIRKYIQDQEKEDQRQDQLPLL